MFARKRHRAIQCLQCGYDITGLPRESVCPECALPLRKTLEAAMYLRSYPQALVRKIDQGVRWIACTPVALAAGVPLGTFLMVVWDLFDHEAPIRGLVVGFALGCVAAAACFGLGAVRLTSLLEGGPVRPDWARLALRYVGPVAAALDGVSPLVQWAGPNLSHVPSLAFRAACQLTSLIAVGATLRLFQSLEHQTQWGRDARLRYWYGWGLLIVLAFAWALWYWWLPLRSGPFRPAPGFIGPTDWGGYLLAGAIVLEAGVLWCAVDSVAMEAIVAQYDGSTEDQARTIAP
jgi:hypothetical protein